MTTVSVGAITPPTFVVYPNPSDGNFVIRFEEGLEKDFRIEVVDMNGRQVYVKQTELSRNRSIQVSLPSNLPEGLYMMKLSQGKREDFVKLQIQ